MTTYEADPVVGNLLGAAPASDQAPAGPPHPADGDPCPHEPFTELGIARRLVALHGHMLRFVPTWRRWLVWDGRRWREDTTGEASRRAKSTARNMLHWAANMDSEHPDKKKAIRAALRGETAGGVNATLVLAGTEAGIALDPSDLDADPWLFNLQNGTLDLRTMELLPHNPAQHITKVAGAAYDPNAPQKAFTEFLERIQPDGDMRVFLARMLGYALSGKVTEHVLPILYGSGANGKSTLLEAVLKAFGDYGQTTDPGLLIDRGDSHPTGIADLFGCRIAVTHETDSGRHLAEGTVKRLTGGDTIKARRMRENFWEFTPTHTVVMVTNHKPIVRGRDEGIWRRLRLVPFEVQVPKEEQDSHLPERLETELDGILAWLINGYQQWRSDGLGEPKAVMEATAEYRQESDTFGRWLEACCITGPLFFATAKELFGSWQTWCQAEHFDAGTTTAFGRELAARGFEKEKKGTVRWRGLGIATESDDDPRFGD